MLAQPVENLSMDSFHEHSAGKRVVLMYPFNNFRTLFLRRFLSNAEEGLLYYRIPADRMTLETWLTDLLDEFSAVLGGFGEHTRATLHSGNSEEMGRAFAADLGDFSTQPTIFFIDEFDRLPMSDHVSRFIHGLVAALPEHVQIALSSRMMTYQPWNGLIANGDAIVLGNQQRRSDLTFTRETQPKPQLEVYAFGRGRVLLNGQEITTWEGVLPRRLFYYLIDHPLVTRDEIFQDFWKKLTIKDATDIFHVTKHKITEVISRRLGAPKEYELTAYKQGFYIPSEKMVRHYDAENFHDAVERALNANDEKEAELFLTRALDLYKGPFLEGEEAAWAVRRREQLAQEHSEALILMGRIDQKRGEYDRALEMFQNALIQRPEREDVHRHIIQIYLDTGREQDARQHYADLEQRLSTTLNITPSPETRSLIERA